MHYSHVEPPKRAHSNHRRPFAYQKFSLDRTQADRHVSALDRQGIPHLFAVIPEAPGAPGIVRHLHGSFAEAADQLDDAQRMGCGVFVTVNEMHGRRRIKASVARTRAVWCERDQPGPRLPLDPSLRIRTSPGRGHDYLLCDPSDPLALAEAERINRQIATEYGGDRQACDLARVLRLAGSWHLKAPPFRVEIIGGTGETYSRAELIDAFPAPPPMPRPPVMPARVECSDRYIAVTVNALLVGLSRAHQGTRNSTLNRCAFRLGQLGLGLETAAAYLRSPALKIGLGKEEIDLTIASGVKAGAENPRGRVAA